MKSIFHSLFIVFFVHLQTLGYSQQPAPHAGIPTCTLVGFQLKKDLALSVIKELDPNSDANRAFIFQPQGLVAELLVTKSDATQAFNKAAGLMIRGSARVVLLASGAAIHGTRMRLKVPGNPEKMWLEFDPVLKPDGKTVRFSTNVKLDGMQMRLMAETTFGGTVFIGKIEEPEKDDMELVFMRVQAQ